MNGSGDFNMRFDSEIEEKMKTTPITRVPDFEPYITQKQEKYLATLPTEEQRYTRAVFMAMSVPDQKLDFWGERIIHLNGIERERQRRELNSKSNYSGAIAWIVQTVVSAAIVAAFMFLFKLL